MRKPADDEDADTEVLPTAKTPERQDFQSGEFRTRFAMQAVDLAEVFGLLVGSTPVKGPVQFRVELSAPDGPSTGGGTQSVQHIKLVPVDGGATLVAGWVDQMAQIAELRTLDHLNAQHQERFSKAQLQAPPPPSERLDTKHYGALLERLRAFLTEREIRVRVVDAFDVKAKRQKEPEAAPRPSFLLWAVALIAFATVAAVLFVRFR